MEIFFWDSILRLISKEHYFNIYIPYNIFFFLSFDYIHLHSPNNKNMKLYLNISGISQVENK